MKMAFFVFVIGLMPSMLLAYENAWVLNTSETTIDFSNPSNWKFDDASQSPLTAFPLSSSFIRLFGNNKTFYLGENVSVGGNGIQFNTIKDGVVTFDLNGSGSEEKTLSAKFGANATMRQSSKGTVRVTSGRMEILDGFQVGNGNSNALEVVGANASVVGPVAAGYIGSGCRFEVRDGGRYEGALTIGRVNNDSCSTVVRAANGGTIKLAGVLTYASPKSGQLWENQMMIAEDGGCIDFNGQSIDFAKSNDNLLLCMTNNSWVACDHGIITNLLNFCFWQGARNVFAATNAYVHLRGAFQTNSNYPPCSNQVDLIGSFASSTAGFSAQDNPSAFGNTVRIGAGAELALNGDLALGDGHDNVFLVDGLGTHIHTTGSRNITAWKDSAHDNLFAVSDGAAITNFNGFTIRGTNNYVRISGIGTRVEGVGTFALSSSASSLGNTVEVSDGALFKYERWRVAAYGGYGAHLVVSNGTAVAVSECYIPHNTASSNNTVRLAGESPLLKATGCAMVFRSNTAVTFALPAAGYERVPIVCESASHDISFGAGTSINVEGLPAFLRSHAGVQLVRLVQSSKTLSIDAETLASANARLAASGADGGYVAELYLSADGETKADSNAKYLVLRGKNTRGLTLVVR